MEQNKPVGRRDRHTVHENVEDDKVVEEEIEITPESLKNLVSISGGFLKDNVKPASLVEFLKHKDSIDEIEDLALLIGKAVINDIIIDALQAAINAHDAQDTADSSDNEQNG